MNKNTVIVIILFFLFLIGIRVTAQIESDKNKKLHLNIQIEKDTCYYYDSEVEIVFTFRNERLLPVSLNKLMGITTWRFGRGIELLITHKNELYCRDEPGGKDNIPKLFFLNRWNKLVLEEKIDFQKLFLRQILDRRGLLKLIKIDNKKFGSYQIQAVYISEGDSIFSNTVDIRYLPSINSDKD